jgi:phage head maturation protease
MTALRDTRFVRGGLAYRAAGDGPGAITWRAPVFGVLSADFGGWRELCMPSSVTRSIARDGQIAQYNHRSMIASRRAGTLAMSIGPEGVDCEAQLPDTTTGRDVAVLADRGDLTGASFTFQVMTPSYWSTYGALRSGGIAGQPIAMRLGSEDTSEVDDSCEIRVLGEIAVWESGPVDMPAYPDAVVGRARENAATELAGLRGIPAPELLCAMEERRLSELLEAPRRQTVMPARRGMSLELARELARPRV